MAVLAARTARMPKNARAGAFGVGRIGGVFMRNVVAEKRNPPADRGVLIPPTTAAGLTSIGIIAPATGQSSVIRVTPDRFRIRQVMITTVGSIIQPQFGEIAGGTQRAVGSKKLAAVAVVRRARRCEFFFIACCLLPAACCWRQSHRLAEKSN